MLDTIKNKVNMSRLDQGIRATVGLALMYIGFVHTSLIDDAVFNVVVGTIGVVNFVVSLLRVCPVYFVFGLSSIKHGK